MTAHTIYICNDVAVRKSIPLLEQDLVYLLLRWRHAARKPRLPATSYHAVACKDRLAK